MKLPLEYPPKDVFKIYTKRLFGLIIAILVNLFVFGIVFSIYSISLISFLILVVILRLLSINSLEDSVIWGLIIGLLGGVAGISGSLVAAVIEKSLGHITLLQLIVMGMCTSITLIYLAKPRFHRTNLKLNRIYLLLGLLISVPIAFPMTFFLSPTIQDAYEVHFFPSIKTPTPDVTPAPTSTSAPIIPSIETPTPDITPIPTSISAPTDTTEATVNLDSEPVTLAITGPASVTPGETFKIDVIAQDISTPGLYGVQLEINYDPSLISVNNLQPNPNLSFVVLNSADNTNGKIKLVASQQGEASGLTGDVTLLSFDATAANTSEIANFTFENDKISNSQAQGFNIVTEDYTIAVGEAIAPEPTNTPTLEPTNEPTSEPTQEPTLEPTDEPIPEPIGEPTTASVSGQVILTGRAGDDWSGAVVTIDDSGQVGTTDVNGDFIIANVTPGLLGSITIDAPGYLPAVCTEVTVTAPETVLTAISLLSGDINDDNLVDLTDATAVGSGFGQTGSDLPADVTRGGVLDIFDIVLVSVNFGEEGPQSWNCLDK